MHGGADARVGIDVEGVHARGPGVDGAVAVAHLRPLGRRTVDEQRVGADRVEVDEEGPVRHGERVAVPPCGDGPRDGATVERVDDATLEHVGQRGAGAEQPGLGPVEPAVAQATEILEQLQACANRQGMVSVEDVDRILVGVQSGQPASDTARASTAKRRTASTYFTTLMRDSSG